MDRLINRVTSFTATGETDPIPLLKCTACIGHGSFGLVFKAIDPATKSTSAVKFLFPDSEEEKRIMRECSITANLEEHENVVRVISVIEKQFTLADLNQLLPENLLNQEQSQLRAGYAYRLIKAPEIRGILIQMELCGENLRKWINIQIDVQDTVDTQYQQVTIVRNIIAGLTYLHENNIIHGDLKPENVMFTKFGFVHPVKIGGFGLSRNLCLEENQNSTSRAGNFDYMAPESFARQYSFPADLFSLGLVIWEVVQLIKFNERKNLFDRLVNDNNYELVKLPPLLKGFRGLIIALAKRNVDDRLKTMQEVNQFILESKMTFNIFAKNSGHNQENANQGEANNVTVALQVLPILVFILVTLVSSFFVQDPAYSPARTQKYNVKRATGELEVPYYVKETFVADFQGNLKQLEAGIEEEYISYLRNECFKQRNFKEHLKWRAKNFGDENMLNQAIDLQLSSCDALDGLRQKNRIYG